MLSQELAPVEKTKSWQFLELWVDPVLFPPKILMLIRHSDGSCQIFNPTANYHLVTTHPDYESAKAWLIEDEYERFQDQLLAEDFF